MARINSSKWAVSSRGFGGTFSNKLLVQIDGRSVYTPSYSGVYWDMQNVMIQDIERIEVIRGPGATLWGANAVNGVINIITKTAADTLGGLVSTGAGNHETCLASVRYGRQFNPDLYGRFYVNHHGEDSYQYLSDNSDSGDDWQVTSGGFRLDRDVQISDSWTLQGDVYNGQEDQEVFPYWTEGSPVPSWADETSDIKGHNLLGRWQHHYTETNAWTLQAYFDSTDRQEIYLDQEHRTFDLDFQHRFQWLSGQDIVWGLGYRYLEDHFENSYMLALFPNQERFNLFSGFFQDEINLVSNRLWLTLGTKFEHNDYTGLEAQPSARLLWKPWVHHNFWASVSRAVRTPSRAEDSGRILVGVVPYPPYPAIIVNGSSAMDVEKVVAYEAGYRYVENASFSVDFSFFYNDYSNLTDFSYLDAANIKIVNGMSGNSRGLEVNAQWQPLTWLTTELNYTYIDLQMTSSDRNAAFSSGIDIVTENSSPRHQVFLTTGIDVRKNIRLNILGRYVDQLKVPSPSAKTQGLSVDDYLAMDVNVCWSPTGNLELMLAGQNLTDSAHLEFVNEYFTPAIEIEPSVYARLTWKF